MIKIVENLNTYYPKNEYSEFIKQYYLEIIKNGTKKYIENIDVEVKILEVNGTLIPITFGNSKKDSCFSSSVFGMFEYLLYESNKLENIFIKYLVKNFSKIILSLIKFSKIYLVIFVNNNLLSTNIYPKINEGDFEEIKTFLLKNFPKYSIIFRTINDTNKNYIENLNNLGFKRVIFRQIYISYKEKLSSYLKIKQVNQDRKIFNKSNYTKISKKEYSKEDLIEIKKCYDNLYLGKYSSMNPRLTINFFENIQKNNHFFIDILQNNLGEINATYGYIILNNQTTAPIFGYKNENLYRHITYNYVMTILKTVGTVNRSSGVGTFKMYRGAEKQTEYFFIFYNHLGFFQKIIWKIIYKFSKIIGEPFFKNNII